MRILCKLESFYWYFPPNSLGWESGDFKSWLKKCSPLRKMCRRNWVHSAWAGTAAGREATTEYQGGGDQELDPMLIEHYLCNDHEKDNAIQMTTVLKMITMMTTKAVANKDSGSGGESCQMWQIYLHIFDICQVWYICVKIFHSAILVAERDETSWQSWDDRRLRLPLCKRDCDHCDN